ncbi:MAG: glycosyltransferase AglD [Thermoplasmata archaeon]|jgi:glycosyltransferase involved in cell wall biosynthesis|nr:glycosyltransferase AglD [Thermoplasmata archaeon]
MLAPSTRPLDRIRHHAPAALDARCAFSIIVPAYNEQVLLEDAVERTVSLMGGTEGYEIVIVEDGCTDYTPVIAAQLRRRYPHVQHIHSRVRLGKGRAVAEGMRVARGDVVVLMDADMATDPRHLLDHVRRVEMGEADVIVGSRYHPKSQTRRAPLRLLYSRVYNAVARWLLRSTIRDHQCGFKVFDKRAMRSILPFVKADRFFWDTEVLAIAQWFGYRVKEVPIVWREGKASKVRLFRTPLEMFGALILLAVSRRWRVP